MSGYQEPTVEEILQSAEEELSSGANIPVQKTVIDHETNQVVHDRTEEEPEQLEPTTQLLQTLTAVVINLQRDFDTFKSAVGSAFKEIGHADTWRKIAGE